MTDFEVLLEEAFADNVNVIENYDMGETRLKGLYCDGTVAISNSVHTEAERACIAAEELGHHYTTSGNILDLSSARNRKQERKARLWAYDKRIGLLGFIQAYEHGCHSFSDTAEFLDITEEFLVEAIECYRTKYGLHVIIDNYVIQFEPVLGVAKLFYD